MTDAPLCAAPLLQTLAPRHAIPAGACDCHFHISEGPSPLVAERSYTPPPVSMADYLTMRNTLGLSRGVIVQASPHGTDNRTTLNALPDDGSMRAVVVVDADCPKAELQRLTDEGAVGTRANLLFSSDAALDDLAGLARRCADIGWHLQLLVDVSRMAGLTALVHESPVPIVIDHMGHVPARQGVDDAGFQTLLKLLDTGRVWVKLSGAYRISDPDYGEASAMARALVAANTDRLVWGTDWPHPAIAGPMPNDGPLLDLMFTWADAATVEKILVTNPETLYGFPKWEGPDGT